MDDSEILESIHALVEDEHRLMEQAGSAGLSDDEEARLHHLEERLDQCWDLLRQRRARRRAGLDPDDAEARDVDTVEHYRQ